MLAQGGLLGLGDWRGGRRTALRPFERRELGLPPGGNVAGVAQQQEQPGGHGNDAAGQQPHQPGAAGSGAAQSGLRTLHPGVGGPNGTSRQLGQAKGGSEQVVGAGVLKGQAPTRGAAEDANTGQLRAVGFVQLALQACHGGTHGLPGLGNGHAQVLAQGIHQQAVVAGEGLVECHELGGRAQRLAAGQGARRRGIGHKAPKFRNNDAVVVAEQGADVVG